MIWENATENSDEAGAYPNPLGNCNDTETAVSSKWLKSRIYSSIFNMEWLFLM